MCSCPSVQPIVSSVWVGSQQYKHLRCVHRCHTTRHGTIRLGSISCSSAVSSPSRFIVLRARQCIAYQNICYGALRTKYSNVCSPILYSSISNVQSSGLCTPSRADDSTPPAFRTTVTVRPHRRRYPPPPSPFDCLSSSPLAPLPHVLAPPPRLFGTLVSGLQHLSWMEVEGRVAGKGEDGSGNYRLGCPYCRGSGVCG